MCVAWAITKIEDLTEWKTSLFHCDLRLIHHHQQWSHDAFTHAATHRVLGLQLNHFNFYKWLDDMINVDVRKLGRWNLLYKQKVTYSLFIQGHQYLARVSGMYRNLRHHNPHISFFLFWVWNRFFP